MSKFKGFAYLILILEIILILACNGLYLFQSKSNVGRLYRVEAARVAMKLKEQKAETLPYNEEVQGDGMAPVQDGLAGLDLSEYRTIIRVSIFNPEEACNNDYLVEEVNGQFYRIEYNAEVQNHELVYINAALMIMFLLTVIVLWYIYKKILQPFYAMSNLSYELAKGNLSVPVKEEKSKLFGKFLWGMDMLREKLEDNREKELEFQKDRKTLILSLSHDIKTPLSAIELYSKALSEDLYDSKEKKQEALQGIIRNVKEIKKYVEEIVTASREDFLNLEVMQGECYLSEVIKAINVYYQDKLSVLHTEFARESIEDCLIKADKNRLIEVLQNMMENAIKYGDGKRIRIYGSDEEDCKLIHIENTGCNLKEEELPNLFDSFYRGSNSHGIKGNGLGLYICQTLMRKMDGEIFAEVHGDSFCVTVVIPKA